MIKWTRESITSKASEFTTKVEFMRGAPGAYDACHRRFPGLIDELFVNTSRFLTKDQLILEALKYKSRGDFVKADRGAYYSLITRYPKLIDQLIPNTKRQWDLESVLNETQKYSSISEFQIKACGAYRWARRNSKELISMFFTESDKRNIRDCVYIWKVSDSDGIYKIGLTSSSLNDMRIKHVKWAGKFKNIEIISLTKVGKINAVKLERVMKSIGKPVKFENKFDGYTEFRHLTVQEVESIVGFINIMKDLA